MVDESISKRIRNLRCQSDNCCDRDSCDNPLVRLKIVKAILEEDSQNGGEVNDD